MENPTLAEDPPSSVKPPDPPTSKRRRRAAEPVVSPEQPLAGARSRRGARVSVEVVKGPLAPAPLPGTTGSDRAGGGGGTGKGSFRAGDLVWGKLKIRAWWPGKVLDPSENAARVKRDGEGQSVLVAFFGDGTVAWFEPSDLKQFGEEFRQMLEQSSSDKFVKAVKDALVEIEKRLQSEMSCYCSPSSNYEIAQGVGKPWVSNYSPAQFYEQLLDAARDASGNDMLDIVLLRSWALAFQRGVQCPTDLVEKDLRDDQLHGSATDELQVVREVTLSGVMKGPGMLEVSKQRKERSIAELIADKGSEIAEPYDNKVKVATFDKLPTSSSSESQKRKKKGEKGKSSEDENGIIGVQEEKAIELDKPVPSSLSSDKQMMKGEKSQSSCAKNDGVLDELETRSSGRERRRSKYLSPPYTYVSVYNRHSVWMNNDATERPNKDSEASRSPFTGSLENVGNINQVSEKEDDKTSTAPDGDWSSTNGILSMFLSVAMDPLFLKWSRSANAVRDFFDKFRSSAYSNGSNFLSYQKFLNNLGSEGERSIEDYLNNSLKKDRTAGKRNKRNNWVSDEAPSERGHDLRIPTEPVKVQKRRKIRRHDDAEISVTIDNSSANGLKEVNYPQEMEISNGNDVDAKNKVDLHDELRNKAEGGKSKRRTNKGKDAAHAETQSDTDTRLADHYEPNKLGKKRKKDKSQGKTETASELEQKRTNTSEGARSKQKRKKKEDTNCQNPASLLLKFAPGTALPSKGDIISRFGIYGPLIKSDTEILQSSHCVRIVFERGTDAEKALKSLDNSGSLAYSVADCELHYLSGSVTSQLQTSTVLKTPLTYIRKSLERMISKLTGFVQAERDVGSSNRLRPEITDNLVCEMHGLLKKVNKLLAGHSVST